LGLQHHQLLQPGSKIHLPGQGSREFKVLVKRLHEADIEVILDVVYNHTGEGNHLGPTLSFRGIDNASYYMLADDRRFYFDATGTGNTVNLRHPRVLQMVMDSLRYWVEDCHVDGFRFDLSTSLGRNGQRFDADAAFFNAVTQDPVLSGAKLIAEPWTSARTAISSAITRRAGRNGTGATATTCAAIGVATPACCRLLHGACSPHRSV
jgi:glycogen operon protein